MLTKFFINSDNIIVKSKTIIFLILFLKSYLVLAKTELKIINSSGSSLKFLKIEIDSSEKNTKYSVWNLSKNKQIGGSIQKNSSNQNINEIFEIQDQYLNDKLVIISSDNEIIATLNENSKSGINDIVQANSYLSNKQEAPVKKVEFQRGNSSAITKNNQTYGTEIDQISFLNESLNANRNLLKRLRNRNVKIRNIIQQNLGNSTVDCEKPDSITNQNLKNLCLKYLNNNLAIQKQIQNIEKSENQIKKFSSHAEPIQNNINNDTHLEKSSNNSTEKSANASSLPLEYENLALSGYYERAGPVQDKLVEIGVNELKERGIPLDKNLVEFGKKILEDPTKYSPHIMAAVAVFLEYEEGRAPSYKETQIYAPTKNALGSLVWNNFWNNQPEIEKVKKIISDEEIQKKEDNAKLVIKAIEDKENKSKNVNKGFDINKRYNFVEQKTSQIFLQNANVSVDFLSLIPKIPPKKQSELIIAFPISIPVGVSIQFKYDDGSFVVSDQRSPDGSVKITKKDNNINEIWEVSTDGVTWYDDIKYHPIKNDDIINIKLKENKFNAFFNYYSQSSFIDFTFISDKNDSGSIRINLSTLPGCNADKMNQMDYSGNIAPIIFKTEMNEQCYVTEPLSRKNNDGSWDIRGVTADLPQSEIATEIQKDCREVISHAQNSFNKIERVTVPYTNPFTNLKETRLQGSGCNVSGKISYFCEINENGHAFWKYKSGKCEFSN